MTLGDLTNTIRDLPPGGLLVAAVVVMANLVGFVQMGLDKRQAVRGGWRISERRLIAPVLFGGLPGVVLGMKQFRHKTKKPAWRAKLAAAAVVFGGVLWFVAFREPGPAA